MSPMYPRSSAIVGFAEKVAAVRREGGSTAVVSRASERILAPVWVRIAARRLEHRLRRAGTLSDQLDVVYAFAYRHLSLGPSQIASELEGFLETVRQGCPRKNVESGTRPGGAARPFGTHGAR